MHIAYGWAMFVRAIGLLSTCRVAEPTCKNTHADAYTYYIGNLPYPNTGIDHLSMNVLIVVSLDVHTIAKRLFFLSENNVSTSQIVGKKQDANVVEAVVSRAMDNHAWTSHC
jgi:hypothetical protein